MPKGSPDTCPCGHVQANVNNLAYIVGLRLDQQRRHACRNCGREALSKSKSIVLRVTPGEHALWAERAGRRNLSGWLRSLANAAVSDRALSSDVAEDTNDACEQERTVTGGGGETSGAGARGPGGAAPAVTGTTPAEMRDREGHVVARAPTPAVPAPPWKPTSRADMERDTHKPTRQCPRWMHHRPGVYCSSCGDSTGARSGN